MRDEKMVCRRCGNCCINAFFTLSHLTIAGKEIALEELAKWLEYHRCEAKKVSDLLEIKIPLPCINLGFKEDSGEYFCKIYHKRPQICREFFCKRAKEG